MKFLVVNGPNLNLLGRREPAIYGRRTYAELTAYLQEVCASVGAECEIFQSNHEGAIIDRIQAAMDCVDGLVINPAGYTHTSVAIADCIRAVELPAVEVHLSDIHAREDYRRVSYTAPACLAAFCGKGFESYGEAVRFLAAHLKERDHHAD